MRSLYRISLALLALGFLAVAGSAFAQEAAKPTFTITSSSAGAAFGMYTFDKTTDGTSLATQKGFSEYVTSWETRPRLTWATDTFQAIVSIRVRGSIEGSGVAASAPQPGGSAFTSTKNDVYGEAWWTPGAFKLGIGKFQGQAWNQPISGTYIIQNDIGDGEYWMNWTGVSGLDAEYNLGIVQVGVAVASQCNPSCNYATANKPSAGAGANGLPSTAPSETGATINEFGGQTLAPHIAGKVGDISFRAMLPSTAATLNDSKSSKTSTLSGGGYQAGVLWSGPAGLAVSADVGSFNDAKSKILVENKSRERDSYNVRVDIPGGPGFITLAYFGITDNLSANGTDSPYSTGGKNSYATTTATVRYNYVLPFGVVTPEFRSASIGGAVAPKSGTKQKDAADSEFRLILNYSL